MLILLALPLIVGGLKQGGPARWALLTVASAMFAGAALITIFLR